MTHCTGCGVVLGRASFCTNCGRPATDPPALPGAPADASGGIDETRQSRETGTGDTTSPPSEPSYLFPPGADPTSPLASYPAVPDDLSPPDVYSATPKALSQPAAFPTAPEIDSQPAAHSGAPHTFPSAAAYAAEPHTPSPTSYYAPPSPPAVPDSTRYSLRKVNSRRVLQILTALLLVAAIAGGGSWWLTRTDTVASNSGSKPPKPLPSAAAPTPSTFTSAAPSPPVASPTPPKVRHRPARFTPSSALRLTTAEAIGILTADVRRDRSAVSGLSGWWVPQVSSKCAGLDVDLGPHFRPDGVVDTYGVSEQQILAMHTALRERYSAVTTTAADLGVRSLMPAPCSSRNLWVSLVPERFGTAAGALAWCDQQSIPVGECGARLVMPAGVPGTRLMLRPGA
jgi:hypothetical protein